MAKTGPKPRQWEATLEIIQDNSYLDEQTGCFIWDGSTAGNGYGTIRCEGQTHYIHRLIYKKLVNKDCAEVIRHKCDTPACWNPDHLIEGTHADNVNDKVERQRHCHGQTHYKAALSDDEVLAIYNSDLPNETLASKYNVTRGCINGIRSGRTWKHLTRPKERLTYIRSH